jgi:6-phosphogluconolactonase
VERADVSGALGSPEVRIGDASEVAEMLAADLEACVRRSAPEGRAFTLAIPGGSVATRCFPRLSTMDLGGSRLEFFWVDERALPPSHADSNYGLATQLWLGPANVPAECIHRMAGEAPDLARAARDYAAELTRHAGAPPRLDYVLLGVGSDGHVASLFPGHPGLRETGPALAIEDSPVPPPRRLSLSLSALSHGRRVAIVAFGASKARVIRECLEDPDSSLPVARVARAAERCVFLLDEAAGAGVQARAGDSG